MHVSRRLFSLGHSCFPSTDNTALIRMDAVNEDTITHYFDLLKKTLEESGLINSPERIYNVDETGVPLDPKAPYVVTKKKGTKKV